MTPSKLRREPRFLCQPYLAWGLAFLLLALIAAIILLSSVPPIDRDALTHHLYIPRLYLELGGMVELPDLEFSFFPMNLERIFCLPDLLCAHVSSTTASPRLQKSLAPALPSCCSLCAGLFCLWLYFSNTNLYSLHSLSCQSCGMSFSFLF